MLQFSILYGNISILNKAIHTLHNQTFGPLFIIFFITIKSTKKRALYNIYNNLALTIIMTLT